MTTLTRGAPLLSPADKLNRLIRLIRHARVGQRIHRIGNPYIRDIAPMSAGPTTLVYDTFTDTNGTAITDHTPDVDTVGGGWIEENGDLIITSNKCYPTGSIPAGIRWLGSIQTNQSNVVVSGVLGTDGASHISALAVRVSNSSGIWYCRLNSANDTIEVVQYDGSHTVQATAESSYTNPYTLTVTTSGQTIQATVGAATATYNSASFNQTATKHGVRYYASADYVDDFEVTL